MATGLSRSAPVNARLTDGWRALLDAVPAAVLIVGHDGTIRFTNRQLEELTGYRRGELHGQTVEVLVPEGRRASHQAARAAYEEAPAYRPMGQGLGIVCRRADGTTFPADVSLSPFRVGGRQYIVATVADETERLRTEEELFHRAVHDPLTGLANRVLLLDRLGQAMARADRQAHRLTVLYVDLDGFKVVNDRWGHGVGDHVLRSIAERLAGVVRPEDTVARFGGDEFVIVCEGLTGVADAIDVAERILATVARPVSHPEGKAGLSASVGLAIGAGDREPAGMIEAADRAMYRAKRRGGGGFEVVER